MWYSYVASYNSCIVSNVCTLFTASLICTSVYIAAAIGIHNFPEGIATFIVGLATPELGIALAIAVAVHNIPEGIINHYCLAWCSKRIH